MSVQAWNHPLSIPRTEALALPIVVEQTTSEPTPIWYIHLKPLAYLQHTLVIFTDTTRAYTIHHWPYNHTLGIYRCYVQDCNHKFARFRYVKNKAFSKRLSYVWILSFPTLCPQRTITLNKCHAVRRRFPNLSHRKNRSYLYNIRVKA